MVWVVRAEAALFLGAAVVLLALHRRRPARVGWQRTVQLGLAASLALGGLRAAFWALGMPVHRANLLIALLAGIGGVIVLRRRRARAALLLASTALSQPLHGQSTSADSGAIVALELEMSRLLMTREPTSRST